MKIFIYFILLFFSFTQAILSCDAPIKIKGRGRAGSFLEPGLSDSTPTSTSLHKTPRSSKSSAFAAYNALLEDKLQPSESRFPSFLAEMDHLQKYWDDRQASHISSEIRAELGARKSLLLHVPHVFKPNMRDSDGTGIKMSGFHHDPERILQNSGLLSIESETRYTNGSYNQRISTPTTQKVYAKKSFFPDSWNRQETLGAILLALKNAKKCDSDEDDGNKEFTGIAPTTPPTPITIRIRFLPGKAFITTVHPKL